MELEFKDPLLLAKIFEISKKNNVTECLVFFDKETIYAQSMDSAHVSMVNFSLNVRDVCTKYNLMTSELLTVGINIESYLKVMKLVKGKKNVKVSLSMNTKNMDIISFLVTMTNNTFAFDLKLMDIQVEQLVIQNYDNFTRVRFPVREISDLLSSIEGDVIELGVSENEVTSMYYNIKSDIGELSGKITNGEHYGNVKTIRMKLSLNCIKNFCVSPCDIGTAINFVFQDEFPIKLLYEIGEKSFFELYIAPKEDF